MPNSPKRLGYTHHGQLEVLDNLYVQGLVELGTLLTLANVNNAILGKDVLVDIGPTGALANGTTYTQSFCPGRASKITRLTLCSRVAPIGGVNTFSVKKNNGNTMLSTANIDPTTLTNDTGLVLTLTSTAADLTLAATDTVTIIWVSGTQTTAAIGPGLTVEYVPTADF